MEIVEMVEMVWAIYLKWQPYTLVETVEIVEMVEMVWMLNLRWHPHHPSENSGNSGNGMGDIPEVAALQPSGNSGNDMGDTLFLEVEAKVIMNVVDHMSSPPLPPWSKWRE